jgi:hypothetical protein
MGLLKEQETNKQEISLIMKSAAPTTHVQVVAGMILFRGPPINQALRVQAWPRVVSSPGDYQEQDGAGSEPAPRF